MGRPSSVDRLVRLLALPAWVAEHPGASFDEAAAHFGVGARTIERDVYTLWVSGLPGGLPDALVDFDADDFESRRLRLTRPLGLDRPIRLSREEAVSLLLALRVLIGLLDADAEAASPLRRAEAAVSALLGYERPDSAQPPDAPTGGDGLPNGAHRRDAAGCSGNRNLPISRGPRPRRMIGRQLGARPTHHRGGPLGGGHGLLHGADQTGEGIGAGVGRGVVTSHEIVQVHVLRNDLDGPLLVTGGLGEVAQSGSPGGDGVATDDEDSDNRQSGDDDDEQRNDHVTHRVDCASRASRRR